jgi:hypothetical protein
VERIRVLLDVLNNPGRPCADARGLFETAVQDVRARISELVSLEKALSHEVQTCASECATGKVETCVIRGSATWC